MIKLRALIFLHATVLVFIAPPLFAAADSGQGSWENTLEARDYDSDTSTILSVITVTTPSDSGDGSLRWAVEQANQLEGPDTITFDPDVFFPGMTIVLTSGQLSLTDTTGTTTIDGSGASVTVYGTNSTRVLTVGAGVSAEISGLTITGGHAVYNGSDYDTGNGGGIYNFGDLTVSGSIFTNNNAYHEGGGIYNAEGAHLTVTGDTNFSRNSADFGGGIGNRGELTVSGGNISYNSAASQGGGIGNAAGFLTVTSSTLSHNSASDGGGGIYNSWEMTISNSVLSYNSAEDGGGIFTVYGEVEKISESTLSGNSATRWGGGIYNAEGNLTISGSTLAYNSASTGGGIYSYNIYYPTISILYNTLVAQNFLHNSDPLSPSDLDGTFDVGSSYTLIGDGSGGLDASLGNLLGTPASPLDAKLGPLQNNGGPTSTHALLDGSPAINAGDPAILPAPDQYDQRGVGFSRVVGGRIDIGAIEVQALTSHHLLVVTDVVRNLIRGNAVPSGVGKSLIAKLNAARSQFERGNTTPVVNILDAFIKQVTALRKAGTLSEADALRLVDAVRLAIDSIDGD